MQVLKDLREEGLGPFVLRRFEHYRRVPGLDDDALGHEDDLIAARSSTSCSPSPRVGVAAVAEPDPIEQDLGLGGDLGARTPEHKFNRGHSALIDSVVYALLPGSGTSPRAVQRRVAREIGQASRSISTPSAIASRLIEDFDIDRDDPTDRLWLWLRLTALDQE